MYSSASRCAISAEREFRIISIKLAATFAVITAALLVYSQTSAFAWDEGFHLLAAQLVSHGKRPYADFLFAQAPLNLYWNALLVKLFGNSWRPAHAAAAIETAAATVLLAGYFLRRFPFGEWRLRMAITAAVLLASNVVVFQYGTIAQPYALCLLAMVAAFRLAVSAADRGSLGLTVLAGAASGAATASTLLSAPFGAGSAGLAGGARQTGAPDCGVRGSDSGRTPGAGPAAGGPRALAPAGGFRRGWISRLFTARWSGMAGGVTT